MKIKNLVLLPEACSGCGGIAQYNRDLLWALLENSAVDEVVAWPRLAPRSMLSGPLSSKLRYVMLAARSKKAYLCELIRAIFQKNQIDLVICTHINLLPLAYSLAYCKKVPLLLVIYGIDAWYAHSRWIVRRIVKRVSGVLSISEVTRKRFLTWSKIDAERVRLIPCAIDLLQYTPGIKDAHLIQKHLLENKIVLMTLGRLAANERYKGIDEVLQVMSHLIKKYPNLIYLIGGSGDDRVRLEEQVSALQLNEHVIFVGFIPEEDKIRYYRTADVFLEAMGCGIPVVASTLDGSFEAVRQGQLGVAVNPGDSHNLEQGIITALSRRQGRPAGLEYFSTLQFAMRWCLELTRWGK